MSNALCGNCRRAPLYAKGRCNACLRYYNKHDVERPARLYTQVLGRHQKHKPRWCKVCGNPHLVANLRCGPCHTYFARNGRERPRHLWGIGAFGWCDCGRPATVQQNGFGCCALHAAT